MSDSSTRVAAPSPPASVTASVGLLVALFGHFPVIWNMDFAIPIKLGINIAFTTGVLCLLTLLSPQRSLKLADWIEREAFNTAYRGVVLRPLASIWSALCDPVPARAGAVTTLRAALS